jgi:hypothetical protein
MRFRTGRPTGRIFFWWLILAVTILAGAEAPATTSKTSIVDVLYRADGTPAQGTLLISWPAFTTAGGDAIAAASLTVSLGADGSVQAALFPNTGSTPQGTYYKVVVDLDDGTRSTEYWVIPHVPQTTIAAVRSSLVPQSQAMQFVGRDYVDSAIASSTGGFVAVELTGSQTIAGVKTFQSSPQVPPPTNPGDAVNQQFVLDTISNAQAAAALAQKTPGTVNALQYQVNGTALASGNLSDAANLAKVSQIPTNTNQLTNGANFITAAGAPVQSVNGQTGAVSLTIPAAQVNSDWNASSGNAQILNKPTLGTAATHAATDFDAAGAAAAIALAIPAASSTTPLTNGTAAVGGATTFARADHAHPTDTSRHAAMAGIASDGANGLTVMGSVAVGTTLQASEAITSSDPRYYGAKCDWNGTTGTDDTAAIQTAVNTVCSGRLVFPPNKLCKITSSLLLLAPCNTGMHIVADPTLTLSGHGSSGIVADPAATSPFIPLVLAAGEVTLEGLTIDGYSSTSGKASAGILCWNCGRSKFDQTTVTNIAGDGYLISDSYYIATSSTTVSPGNGQTITLTGVPFPLTTATSLTVSLEPGTANAENRTPTSVGTFVSGTQTVTINITKTHTAPYSVALMGSNNAITFQRSFATNNAGWGYHAAPDYQDAQNDLHFYRVFAMFNGTGGNQGGLLVDGAYVSGDIVGGTWTSNQGYPIQFGTLSSTAGPKNWNVIGPDDVESNTHNCIYEARAQYNTYYGSYSYLCPPTATLTVTNPISSGTFGGNGNGLTLGPTPKGDFIQVNLNQLGSRGIGLWPWNYNALVQPTWPALTVTGGVIQTGTVTPLTAGANWTQAPSCSISDSTGVGATCTATANNASSLTIASVNITNGGSSYTSPSIVLTGGQDMPFSLHSRGAKSVQLNMGIQGLTAQGGTGGTIFGDGVSATVPVLRIDNLGCISYSESSNETHYGKMCQTFTGKNTYTMPDASGTNSWSMVGLQAGQTRPIIAGTSTPLALYSDTGTASAISTNGTANQVWAMDPTGTSQMWQNQGNEAAILPGFQGPWWGNTGVAFDANTTDRIVCHGFVQQNNTSFSNIYLTVNTTDAGHPIYGAAIVNIPAGTAVCHTSTGVQLSANGTSTTFPCAEGTVTPPPGLYGICTTGGSASHTGKFNGLTTGVGTVLWELSGATGCTATNGAFNFTTPCSVTVSPTVNNNGLPAFTLR